MQHNFPDWEHEINNVTYSYHGWDDADDDVVKIWHDVKDRDGNIFNGPWSPYVVPTLDQFIEFVEQVEKRRRGYDKTFWNELHPNTRYGA
jgi:hypothetical protein